MLVILAGCSQAPPPVADTREADAKAIRDLESASLKAWQAHDAEQVASFWAADADVMNPNMALVKGSAMPGVLKDMLADPNFSLDFTSTKVEVARSGDFGYTQGTYMTTMSDPKTKAKLSEKGKYVTVFQKQADGNWKAVEDIFNADAPAAPSDKK